MRTCTVAAAVLGAAVLLSAPAGAASRYTLVALSHANHTVYEIAPVSGRILHALTLPSDPGSVVVSPDGHTIYVSLPSRGFVQRIDARTFAASGRLSSPLFRGRGRAAASARPRTLALNSAGTKLYVGIDRAPWIVAIDLHTKQSRPVGAGLGSESHFAIQPGTDWLYAPLRTHDRVVVVDTGSNRRMATFAVPGGPDSVGFAPNGDVWFQDARGGSVAVASSMTNRLERLVRTGGRGAGRVAVSPNGAYVASTRSSSGNVTIIDARTRRILKTIYAGRGPAFPIFSPDSATLFVLNRGSGDIAVIDMKTKRVTTHWKIGTDPFGGTLRYLSQTGSR